MMTTEDLGRGFVRSEPGCIFCGVIAGEVPSTTIAQSERVVAFMDINPVTPGHALAVPRSHATDLFDVATEHLAACVLLAQEIAGRAKDRLGADGVNLLNCSGEAARQTVFHFHIHVIPRFMDQPGKDAIGLPWDSVPGNPDEIERIGRLLS
jgi:histidine triad (HIT) family protein